MSSDKSLLELESQEPDYCNLLLNSLAKEAGGFSDTTEPSSFVQVVPKPGFCIKTKDDKNEKIFLNICHAENVPEPKELSEDDLLKLLESEEPTGYRVPMSLGEPHAELDKNGKGCTVYDIVINPKFFKKIQKSELFCTFMVSMSIEGLEEKYGLKFNRESWLILKNKKFMGTLSAQNIRNTPRPFISEISQSEKIACTETKKPVPLIQEISSKKIEPSGKKPTYKLIQEPLKGHPEVLVSEIHLPKIQMASSLTLDIGEDRLLLQTRSNTYLLDIYFPYNVIQEDCGAQFDRKSKILTVRMPVQPTVH